MKLEGDIDIELELDEKLNFHRIGVIIR